MYNASMKCKNILSVFFCLLVFLTGLLPVQAVEYPEIDSTCIFLQDLNTGQILWQENADVRIYPASLTKMMSEIIAIEALDPDDTVTITPAMLAGLAETNASTAGFQAGDEPTVLDLLYGTALPSGADCVNALAMAVDGSVEAFVDHMNRKAAELGMTHTHFVNPTGLHDDNHYSTGEDLALLFTYCLQNELFEEILQTESYTSSPVASAPAGLYMRSTSLSFVHDGIFNIPGFLGGKTGFTYPAGRCLAALDEMNGMRLICILCHGPEDQGALRDAGTLFRWLQDAYTNYSLVSPGMAAGEVAVQDCPDLDSYTLYTSGSAQLDLPSGTEIRYVSDLPELLAAPVEAGTAAGTLHVLADGQEVYTETLYINENLRFSRRMWLARNITAFWHAHKTLIMICAGVLLALCLELQNRRRHRKKRRRKRKSGY
ncbi:MAG: D-alanyl-D-alanine carboxypeptidase [Solobacterium sp.]|nr:D-alanyl-D-alanine carboxypeptidase [Solobacterium sp.]